MQHLRFSLIWLVPWLVVAAPCLMAPSSCQDSFNVVDDDDGDDDDDDNDDTGDDDVGDDDVGDDDTGDDDSSDDDDASGGWLIDLAWVVCNDFGDHSEWEFYAQMSGPCDLAGFELDSGTGLPESYMMQEGANFLFWAELSSNWDISYTCDQSFDIYWWANNLPDEDEAWSSWP